MPAITVILTSYNHAGHIADSIESILGQTFSDFELVIVDDCSSDDSWRVIQSYTDPRIQAIRMEKNCNCAYLPQTVERALGKYIAIAHSDDTWMPQKLEKQWSFLEKHPKYAACFTNVAFIDEESRHIDNPGPRYELLFSQKNRSRFQWLHRFFFTGNCLCHPSVLIHKSAYAEYDLFSIALYSLPDFVHWVRLCMHRDIYVLGEKLTCYRIREDQANQSGENPEVLRRMKTELFFLAREFQRIVDPEVFIKVFPEARPILSQGRDCVVFAYAQMLLVSQFPQYQLAALTILYDLLQDPGTERMLATDYSFTRQDFDRLTKEHDIFGTAPMSRFLAWRLMPLVEGRPDKSRAISGNAYIRSDRQFQISVDVSFSDAEELGLVVGSYENLDLSILQLDGKRCKPLFQLGDSALEDEADTNFWTSVMAVRVSAPGREGRVTVQGRAAPWNDAPLDLYQNQRRIELLESYIKTHPIKAAVKALLRKKILNF